MVMLKYVLKSFRMALRVHWVCMLPQLENIAKVLHIQTHPLQKWVKLKETKFQATLPIQFSVDKIHRVIFQNQLEREVDPKQQTKVIFEALNNNWCRICCQVMSTMINKLNMCLQEVSVIQPEVETTPINKDIQIQDSVIQ